MRGETGLLADLGVLGIPFAAHEHDAVFTVAESDAVHAAMPGVHTKNLFLKDKGGAFWLVTVPSDARVNLKALPAAIGCKHVSFGKAEDMERLLGIAPGSVTPLAAINAMPGSITVVLDAPLVAADMVNVHPLRNTATLGLSGAAILDLLRHWGHQPLVAQIPVQTA
ncbi:MAG TPA: prolyl-tRNA synthetase associated domain-containing protein [Sphingopyxis sp.]|uniref:prolyl-tRNA synthetase associated domain-containing protein n=1 Tax=Sphingopyxis sp. TaxID=1908224 RepID=UPI002C42A57F|nr:prolyl-tRNA synthetase associated domain-containing protein [Sphingopyxis sp.]HWW58690.1 prolyl-tRNA synthetase associated domain-containing protein [Sphingopyxis sp.]